VDLQAPVFLRREPERPRGLFAYNPMTAGWI
jgi:hypothetical protein